MPALRLHLFKVCGVALAAATFLGGIGSLSVATAQEAAEQTAEEDDVF
jgi:hypothetical protein